MTVSRCTVCCAQEKKYKCPTCSALYCSLPCFKQHKELSCQPPPPHHHEAAGPTLSARVATEPGLQEDERFQFQTADTVSLDALQRLDQDPDLLALLSNKHLREFLLRLDSSEDKARLMRKAMKEPLFVEFVDACLTLIEPENAQKELTDEQIVQVMKDQVEAAEDD